MSSQVGLHFKLPPTDRSIMAVGTIATHHPLCNGGVITSVAKYALHRFLQNLITLLIVYTLEHFSDYRESEQRDDYVYLKGYVRVVDLHRFVNNHRIHILAC